MFFYNSQSNKTVIQERNKMVIFTKKRPFYSGQNERLYVRIGISVSVYSKYANKMTAMD